MTPAEISAAKGGEVFIFDYAHCDVADVQTFGAGSWGLYSADTVSVGNTITPDLDNDGITSLPGKITFSVTLFHLDTFSSSHVAWDGSGITVEYALDGVTWAPLAEDAVIPLAGDADFDIRVTFAGGVENDPAVLNSITVYVFATETISGLKSRHATFTQDVIHDGQIALRGGELRVEEDHRDPVTPVAAIEFIGTMDEGNGAVIQGDGFNLVLADGLMAQTGCTVYVDGAIASWVDYEPTESHHYVIVPATPTSAEFTVGLIDMTLTHLALHGDVPDAAVLFNAQTGLVVRVDDDGGPTVTEDSPAVDIYAYAWSIVSGGTA
jgi:hypothetical protein